MKSAVAVAVALAVGLVVGTSFAVADYVPVIGGPTYNASTGGGYQAGTNQLFFKMGGFAGDGFGVESMNKLVAGSGGFKPVRWDSTGFFEFQMLGSSSSGSADGYVLGIGANGASVGTVDKYSAGTLVGPRAVRWDTAGQVTELQQLPNTTNNASQAQAINLAGTVVGGSYLYQLDMYGSRVLQSAQPVRWAAGQTAATPLDTLPLRAGEHDQTFAQFITSNGAAYGTDVRQLNNAAADLRVVRWDAGGTAVTELGNLGVDTSGAASAVVQAATDTGYLAGRANAFSATGSSLGRYPTRWNPDGSIQALQRLGAGTLDYGWDVNNAGTVVGQSRLPGAPEGGTAGMRAVRWDAGMTLATQLGVIGTPTSTTGSWAHDINNLGLAIGTQRADVTAESGIAVLWNPGGSAVDLNSLIDPTLGWKLIQANSITDSNWVEGVGLFDPDGAGGQAAYTRTFLIQIPEPASIGVIAGIGFLMAARRRKPATPAEVR